VSSSALVVGATEAAAAAAAAAPEGEGEEGAEAPAGLDMDSMLTTSLLLALKTTVVPSMLPLLASTFYAQHVLTASKRLRAGGADLNIKQTRWKKFGVFLQVCTAVRADEMYM
jgi:hypothetical protein